MAYPLTPGQSLTAASVTKTAASGQGTTQATAAAFATHAAVFAVTAFNAAGTNAVLNLVIEGNLDGSTWVGIASETVEANGTYLVVPQSPGGITSRIPMANLRTSAYFQGYGSGSPTATVSAFIGSEA
jgi:hypothetical protein